MFGIKINDTKESNVSTVLIDLRDILMVIGETVVSSQWICRDIEYTAMRDEELFVLSEDRKKLSGAEMLQFADNTHQIIDGRFEASSGGSAKQLWLIILAIDSSYFEVWSSKHEVIEKLKGYIKKISDLPPTNPVDL
jgi:hypothetical protein